jgi:hypothetical protein
MIAVQSLSQTTELIKQIQLATSLIENRRFSQDEIIEMIKRVLRQHSLALIPKIDYIVDHLNRQLSSG